MKILHTSDLHIGRFLNEQSLLLSQEIFFKNLYKIIQEEKIDVVVIAGDVYNRSVPSADSVKAFDSFLANLIIELKVKVVMIAGNHDSAKRLAFCSEILRSGGLYISNEYNGEIEKITFNDQYGKVNFFLIPYFIPAQARQYLFPNDEEKIKSFDDAFRETMEHNKEKLDQKERNIAVAHGFFANLSLKNAEKLVVTSDSESSVGGMDIIDANYLKAFDYACLGHIHAPQRVLGENIRYSGSPLKYSFSEEHQKKSVTIIELKEKGNTEIKQVPISQPIDLSTVKGSFDQLLNNPDEKIKNNYLSIYLNDDNIIPSAMQRLKSVYPNVLELRYEVSGSLNPLEISFSEERESKSLPDLFSDFYSLSYEREMTQKEKELTEKFYKKVLKGEEDSEAN